MRRRTNARNRAIRSFGVGLLIVVTVVFAAGVLAGCGSAADSAGPRGDSGAAGGQLEPLSKERREELAGVLAVDLISVYPSDAGLGRVYGQVTNLGETVFAVAEFELISQRSNDKDGTNATHRRVGVVRVTNIEPGESVSFDVIGTVGVEDMQGLRADLTAAQ